MTTRGSHEPRCQGYFIAVLERPRLCLRIRTIPGTKPCTLIVASNVRGTWGLTSCRPVLRPVWSTLCYVIGTLLQVEIETTQVRLPLLEPSTTL